MQGIAKVGAVDVDEHKQIAGRFSISGFPTIKIFGHDKNKPEDYKGERSANALANGVISAIKSKVQANLGGKGSDNSRSDDVRPKNHLKNSFLIKKSFFLRRARAASTSSN